MKDKPSVLPFRGGLINDDKGECLTERLFCGSKGVPHISIFSYFPILFYISGQAIRAKYNYMFGGTLLRRQSDCIDYNFLL